MLLFKFPSSRCCFFLLFSSHFLFLLAFFHCSKCFLSFHYCSFILSPIHVFFSFIFFPTLFILLFLHSLQYFSSFLNIVLLISFLPIHIFSHCIFPLAQNFLLSFLFFTSSLLSCTNDVKKQRKEK